MKLKYLGTAAYEGVPALFCDCPACRAARELGGKNIRTRSQALVDGELLIDFPADTYLHILRDKIKLYDIHSCIITHNHSDHLYAADIPARCGCYSQHHGGEPFTVYATSPGYQDIMRAIHNDALEDDGRLRVVRIAQDDFQAFETSGFRITPLPASHSVYCCPVFYLIQRGGKSLLYAHDTGYFPESAWEFLEREKPHLDCISLDATSFYGDEKGTHMSVSACVEVCERLEQIGVIDSTTRRVLNHFSHNGITFWNGDSDSDRAFTHEGMADYAASFGFELSYDGMELEF